MNPSELLTKINRGKNVEEAALTLGLLLERAHRRRFGQDNAEEIGAILGDVFADEMLSENDAGNVVGTLIRYIERATPPHLMAVWALTKSFDPRVLPALIALLDRVLADPRHEHLANGALNGITLYQTEEAVAAIRRARASGHGQVKRSARQFLDLHGRQLDSQSARLSS